MKRNDKKGFTIVELVIVIAVIAILAAVFIPTFSSMVKKANRSADEQAVRQMNTALAIYTAENGKPSTAADVKKALDENLINAESMIPVSQGYAFFWDKTDNKIMLVSNENKVTVSDSTRYFLLTTTGYGTPFEANSFDGLKNAIEKSSSSDPALITLATNIEVSGLYNISSGNAIIDLNDKVLTLKSVENNEASKKGIVIAAGASLTVKNGSVKADYEAFRNEGGTLVLNGVDIRSENKDNYSTVRILGASDTTITNCNITTEDDYAIGSNAEDARGSRIVIRDSKVEARGAAAIFITGYATVTIDSSEFKGANFGGFFRCASVKMYDSKFYNTENATDSSWSSGATGKAAALMLGSGGNNFGNSVYAPYPTSPVYMCENVTASTVIVHEPTGGKVSVSGNISVGHTCHKVNEPCDCANE